MLFFFFQAEDGIRDTSVTGVQTCALPISATSSTSAASVWAYTASTSRSGRCMSSRWPGSEERRVGKECRSRRAREDAEKEGERGGHVRHTCGRDKGANIRARRRER